MPSVEENRMWGKYLWPEEGDEWSRPWGDVDTQWRATILPRIWRFIPAQRVLEIAPGHGRWSKYLINCADEYIGVDLNSDCISACKARFAEARHATFVVNNGRSLAAVADGSISFAFSFDSLVHAEIDVIEAYLFELSQKLAADGIAFIHHSNLGEYNGLPLSVSRLLVGPVQKWSLGYKVLKRLQLISWEHWRAPSVTSSKVAEIGTKAGLVCIGQEIVNWGHHNRRLIDCISMLTRPESRWSRPNVVVRNPDFMNEAVSANVISDVYTSLRSCG